MNLLLVGRNYYLLQSLRNYSGDLSVYILEEEELYTRFSYELPKVVKEVRFGEYQQSLDCVQAVEQWFEHIKFDAVIPGVEYAVLGAQMIAEKRDLPSIGIQAARAFTDKYEMRVRCEEIGIPQPRYARINSESELKAFFKNKPIVIKPTSIQASIGVIKIYNENDLDTAWEESVKSRDAIRKLSREQKYEYIAEDMMIGEEYSVETIVQRNELVFFNITKTVKQEGKYCVEKGHLLPVKINPSVEKQLINLLEKLVKGLNVNDAFLHSEWIIENGSPKLVECAGRVPGGLIMEMIQHAYDFDPYHKYIETMSGEQATITMKNKKFSALKFFDPPIGEFVEVQNLETIKNHPLVKDWEFDAEHGQLLGPQRNAWDRIGYVMTVADSMDLAQNSVDDLLDKVIIRVK